MDEFKVKLAQMKQAASEENNMSREIGSIRNELDVVRNNLRFQIAQRETIKARLKNQGNALNHHRNKMLRMSNVLSDIADMYERTELGLCGMEPSLAPVFSLNGKLFPWNGILPPPLQKLMNKGVVNIADYWINYEVTIERNKKTSDDFGGSEYEKEHDIDPTHKRDFIKGTYDSETGTWTKVDPKDPSAQDKFDKNMDKHGMDKEIKVLDYGTSTTASWLTANLLLGDEDGTHASSKAEILKGKAYVEAFAGLYQKDPETGKSSFKPGFGASVGASATAFSAEQEAQLGNEALGAYFESTQEVLKAGASAEVTGGLYDSKGKFNPSLYGGLEAEALAGEISATGGVMVAGTKVGVTGSLSYGVGIHAKAGYQDGKLSLDVGATLGVGGGVKLEIDISGTVDAICGGAKAVRDWFT